MKLLNETEEPGEPQSTGVAERQNDGASKHGHTHENNICRPVFHTVLIGHLQQPYEPRLKGCVMNLCSSAFALKNNLKISYSFRMRMNLHAKKSSVILSETVSVQKSWGCWLKFTPLSLLLQ